MIRPAVCGALALAAFVLGACATQPASNRTAQNTRDAAERQRIEIFNQRVQTDSAGATSAP